MCVKKNLLFFLSTPLVNNVFRFKPGFTVSGINIRPQSVSTKALMMGEPIVKVKQGKLRGKLTENIRGGSYYSFQGIPYAKPPIGNLRFKDPQPPEPWNDVRDATEEGNNCYSRDMILKSIKGSEDCLFLNVYTNQLSSQTSVHKPVMVWIHGGAFITGSGQKAVYGPDFLLKEDVVLVTINYRIGVLGFANFKDPSLEVSGNAGLKDMVLALKWVKENISAFGGDSNNITIFGESAGGAAVHFLVLSASAKNLFHKAIAQSGSALNPWARGKPTAALFAEVLGIDDWNEKKVFDILRSLPVEELHQAQEKVKDHIKCSEKRPFGPVIEDPSSKNPFLTEEPLHLIRSGNYSNVPFMTGYTSREGMLYAMEYVAAERAIPSPNNTEDLIPYSYNVPKGSEKSKKIAEDLKRFYFGDEDPSVSNMDSTYLLYTDACFYRGIYETIKEQVQNSKSPIYFYRFSFDGKMNLLKKIMHLTQPGASHADELAYLFSNPLFLPDNREYSLEILTIHRLCKLWTSFARSGNPNFKSEDDELKTEWKPVQKDKLHYAELGENITVGVNPDAARMAFWDRIFGIPSKLLIFVYRMEEPTAKVRQGLLRGKKIQNVNGGMYYSFQGIPYAKPPLGDLRFKAPQPADPWEGILDATKEGNICYQRDMVTRKIHGSEDCLFLNVYINELPKNNENSNKPVMVWIHGGGFTCGSGNTDLYGPDYLLSEDVIVVTINYRLGLFGFLSLEDSTFDIPGNAGLKDMVLALKWVQENIAVFGGNPNNVTIFGESSGGWAVNFLLLSPLAKGLFHRAIMQSGCALNTRSLGVKGVKRIADAIGHKDKSEKEILDVLNNASTDEVFQMLQKIDDDYRTDVIRSFGPVIEDPSDPSAFITKIAIELIRSGNFNQVPVMVGYVTREGMLMVARATIRNQEIPMPTDFERYVPYYLNHSRATAKSIETARKIKEFYFGDDEPSNQDVDSLLQLYTDVFFLRGLHVAATEIAKASSFPVFFYRFSVDAGLNWYKNYANIKFPGVAHCDELGYLFTTKLVKKPRHLSIEDITIGRMTKLWTTFARTGNPNPQQPDENILNVKWLPVTGEDDVNFLDIGENITVGKNPEAVRMKFWKDVGYY
ncbi:uncharacterized protein LOC108744438 [Agrilus planipennis]|uniref:Uncharacterized protein LOC108744438 n=1 Tax=Agrilus planipennis TaxID=224129 RepID=A0A1W4XHU4_AGRPL|nr:uncharacterized protein LOC108744438 [Agrilus planipennis]